MKLEPDTYADNDEQSHLFLHMTLRLKSTLLKILSQITSPSTGTVKMKGRIASLLEVGTGMHPEMTARQNVFLNGSLMGMRKNEIKSKLEEIIDFANDNNKIEQYAMVFI